MLDEDNPQNNVKCITASLNIPPILQPEQLDTFIICHAGPDPAAVCLTVLRCQGPLPLLFCKDAGRMKQKLHYHVSSLEILQAEYCQPVSCTFSE
jgi:hypothetical protein